MAVIFLAIDLFAIHLTDVRFPFALATSNDPMGPTGPEMAEIASMTFNSQEDFYEIMDMIDKRLNDKGKNWRHVLKSLMLLDYIVHEGSGAVVTWCHKNTYVVKTLCEFQYVDENGLDVGQQGKSAFVVWDCGD